ncbi:2-polyprenyl-6-methoxyphenol hydroxylase, partial [hydrothermal vent metagenome]
MSSTTSVDLLIIGGGMVGASLACALKDKPLTIAIVEAVPLHSAEQPSYDDRAIALAYGSQRIFQGIGLWPQMKFHATPIKKIHISDRGHFGITRLDHQKEGVEALGQVMAGRDIGNVLAEQLANQANVELLTPATLSQIRYIDNGIQAEVMQNEQVLTISAKLMVAADGGHSSVRQLLGIDSDSKSYQQSAIIANITPSRPHNHVAYERFTDSGPLALLPMSDNRCSLVWTQWQQDVDEVMSLSDEAFLAQLQSRFGYRLGRLKQVGKRTAYPLHLMRSKEQIRPRLAVIGNAAHAIHPIAGQGFNLGIRDVSALAECVSDALVNEQDIGSLATLQRYAEWRH